jgi:ribosomal protein S18 acetylase RimI-like enzyme
MRMSQDAANVAVEFRGADQVSIDELVTTLNRCFAEYLVPARFDRAAIFDLIRVHSVDLSASVTVRCDGGDVGIALLARRGRSCRVAAMAIEPKFRARRIGTRMTEFLMRAAGDRGDRDFVLEAIEQNPAAVRLYQSAGFVTVRRLVGYRAEALDAVENSSLEMVDPVAVAEAVLRDGVEKLPWQIAPQALAALSPPHQAFRLGAAFAIVTNPSDVAITIRALVVDSAARRQGWGTRLLRALSARFPGRTWRTPLLVPEEIPHSFFARLDFRREPLTQVQMAYNLSLLRLKPEAGQH